VKKREIALPAVYLKPGEMYCAEHPTLIVTVLGSCVSVTMFNRRTGVGAICHGLLPHCRGLKNCGGACVEGFKYVDCSIRQMVKLFDRYGIKRSEIEVKCFGGADMFSRQSNREGAELVGRLNIQTAENIMNKEGLRILTRDVGGLQGRKILFYTDTGEVFLKRLMKTNNPDIRW
jgi:chemotaxis protein CheD